MNKIHSSHLYQIRLESMNPFGHVPDSFIVHSAGPFLFQWDLFHLHSVIGSVNHFGYDHDSLFSCPAIESEYLFGHECDSLVSHSAGQCWSQLIFSIINAIQLAHIQRIQWIIIVMTTVLCSHVHVSVCHSDQEWYFHFYYYRSLYDLFGHDRDLLLTHSAGLWVSESF